MTFKSIDGGKKITIDADWIYIESRGGLGGDYLGHLSMPIEYQKTMIDIAKDYPHQLFINGNRI